MESTITVNNATAQVEEQTPQTQQTEDAKPITFDYDKLAEIVNGRQTVTEEKVLKGYFQEQGLSAEEVKTAIDSYKKQKAESTPDINAMQNDINTANQRAIKAEMKNSAFMMASELGVDVRAMPFLVRMADVSEVVKNGMVDEAVLKAKLEEVITAIPSLKQNEQKSGFQVVGAETSQQAETKDDYEDLKRIFGVKR